MHQGGRRHLVATRPLTTGCNGTGRSPRTVDCKLPRTKLVWQSFLLRQCRRRTNSAPDSNYEDCWNSAELLRKFWGLGRPPQRNLKGSSTVVQCSVKIVSALELNDSTDAGTCVRCHPQLPTADKVLCHAPACWGRLESARSTAHVASRGAYTYT